MSLHLYVSSLHLLPLPGLQQQNEQDGSGKALTRITLTASVKRCAILLSLASPDPVILQLGPVMIETCYVICCVMPIVCLQVCTVLLQRPATLPLHNMLRYSHPTSTIASY